jgi:hypothetical protein
MAHDQSGRGAVKQYLSPHTANAFMIERINLEMLVYAISGILMLDLLRYTNHV